MTVPAGSPQYSGSERRDAHPAPQAAGQPAGGLVAGAPLGSSYRLVRRVGSGAVGEVWAATMSGSWALYAAKVLRPELAENPVVLESFVRERSVLLALSHPHIVPLTDMVVEGGVLALVTEFQHGGSLRQKLDSEGPLPVRLALSLMVQVLNAAEFAHRRGVMHLDIKPENVLLSGVLGESLDQQVRVADFGIASFTGSAGSGSSRSFSGTPGYMAPERSAHGVATPAVDVYACAVTLHELLVAARPLPARGGAVQVSPQIPAEVAEVLHGMLAENPVQRPGAAEAAAKLRLLAEGFTADTVLPRWVEVSSGAVGYTPTVVHGAEPAVSAVPGQNVTELYGAGMPSLGQAQNETVIRAPFVVEQPAYVPDEVVEEEEPARSPLRRPLVWGAILGSLILVGVLAFVGLSGGKGSSKTAESWSASSRSSASLPSGLGTRIEGTYNPRDKSARLTFEFSSQKSALRGDILQVLPGVEGGSCASVTWDAGQASSGVSKNQSSVTAVDVPCSWNLSEVSIPANGVVQVRANVSAEFKDSRAFEEWVNRIDSETSKAISDREVRSTAYPIQRLRSIELRVPSRVVNQSVLPVTVVPVWPSGADELNPLMVLPRTGEFSTLVQAISPDAQLISFSDGCSGHVLVSEDQRVVTALSVTSKCRVNAQIGNFTNLSSSDFAIITR
ncbi:serine/threonine-protein kinase [uncultured Rothia sp.]|uniref:serine/threonine-protein kinase n=1 Tax=uncultured Rothia sp. TaxID=316088 RepID=UPI0026341804|nr:serine/threonine-protein kinase [uncultured Rothia sp.]